MSETVANPQPPTSYVLSKRAKVVHKRLGGMSFEQCNLDAISPSDKEEVANLADIEGHFGVPAHPFRPCRRCFKGDEYAQAERQLRQLSGLAS